MIKYIGSKRLLIPAILECVTKGARGKRVLDLFSGTSRVGHALKRAGYQVTANDHTSYANVLARCYVQADRAKVLPAVEKILAELHALPPQPGYFTDVFCNQSRFVQPKNGARIDAMRERIAAMSLDPDLEAVVLVSLMEAADRVDSTCGLQMAYLKKWAKRSYNDMELRVPDLLDGPGTATSIDALRVAELGEFDVAYLDPPYNQHKYMNNYHVWESLVRWDKPEVYGTACKRTDCRSYDSPFNSKKRIEDALTRVVRDVQAKTLIVSFSDEGYLSYDDLVCLLESRGVVEVFEHDYKRYVGAQIGIYNPSGKKVGRVSHVRNREFLFVVQCRS